MTAAHETPEATANNATNTNAHTSPCCTHRSSPDQIPAVNAETIAANTTTMHTATNTRTRVTGHHRSPA